MTGETSDRTAIITGASRGLGLALARTLAEDGWTLIIDARTEEALENARAELSRYTRVIAIPGDVTDPKHREDLAGAARAAGGVDALVNNASILGPSPQPDLLDYPLEVFEQVYRTNVVSPLALIQALNPHLKPQARIINVTSDAAVEPHEGWGGYGSSKAALEQLSNILAAENPGLRVYRVDPGDMRTQMHQEAFPAEDISDRPLPEESVPGFIELLTGDLPSGRYDARELAARVGIATADSEKERAKLSRTITEALEIIEAFPDYPEARSPLHFELPPELEAGEPPEARGLRRDEVRLMVYYLDDDRVVHSRFGDLPEFLRAGDTLVVNTSGTMNAALPAERSDGTPLTAHLSTHLPADLWVVELRSSSGYEPVLNGESGEVLSLLEGASMVLHTP
jgi:NAD(P)-dependent dehydrogenase (short-subunit alcohol dehydrogenase family)